MPFTQVQKRDKFLRTKVLKAKNHNNFSAFSLATVFAEGSGEEGEIITFNYDASFYVGDFDLSLVRNQDILKAVLNDGKAVFYDFKFESNYVEVFY